MVIRLQHACKWTRLARWLRVEMRVQSRGQGMKRRLFWKILFSFWFTFLCITQALWLVFEINRVERRPPEGVLAEEVAPVLLAAGTDTITRDGADGITALLARLPQEHRERLDITSAGRVLNTAQVSGDRAVKAQATGPDGQVYQLSYRYNQDRRRGIWLNAPPEFVVLGLVGGLLFSALLAWYLTEPIHRLRGGFDRLARGDLEVRLGSSMGRRRDEIADLGRDFDLMARRLEQLVSARDRLLHDVSHELRSPLARLQLAIGLARQNPERTEATLQRIEREAERLDILVGELLALARVENGQIVNDDYFDLAGVIESVAEDARFEATSSDIAIVLTEEIPPEDQRPLITGNAELMRRAVDNIVRNALRFSSAGQEIRLLVRYDAELRRYHVEIADQGPGVAEQDIIALFDPFVRGPDGGSGLGLGLSIASRAIIAHGGVIAARNRPEGGLSVVIELPAISS